MYIHINHGSFIQALVSHALFQIIRIINHTAYLVFSKHVDMQFIFLFEKYGKFQQFKTMATCSNVGFSLCTTVSGLNLVKRHRI